ARHARFGRGDVGESERVHARVLQRGYGAEEQREDDDEGDGGAGADRREERDGAAHDDRVREQHAPVAEVPEEARHPRLQRHRGDRLGHQQEGRLYRRVAEADLIKEREEERNSARAEPRDEAADHSRPERPEAKEGEPKEGMSGGESMPEVAREEDEREREEAENRTRAERVLAEDLEDVGEEANAGAEEDS